MQATLLTAAGVHHPEVGLGQAEVAAHQRQQPTQHHGLQLLAVGGVDRTAGELLGVGGHIDATHHTDGPVLQRFGDRWDGMVAHPANVKGAAGPRQTPLVWPACALMPSPAKRTAQPQGLGSLGLALAATGLAAMCLGAGWWLGQRQLAADGVGSRPTLERQVSGLRRRLDDGEASIEEQQRLLELLVALDRQAEATALLEQLADEQPQRWSLRLLLAELRRDQNDPQGAERELRQLLRQQPDQVEALQLMALLQLEGGRGAEARGQLEAALQRAIAPELRPEALALGLLLANVLEQMGETGAAEAQLIRLSTIFPADPRPLLARALLQHSQGKLKEAQITLGEARSRQSDPAEQERIDRLAAAWGLEALREPESATTPGSPEPAGAPRQSP